ncbi:hypothetical protein SASPL_100220 [Salvia splendens]|uniref:Protein disulfide-isomerase n=1 Tax=Salvia splendens TaxID=180675 RepID=A0A8X8YNS1_SALSN|nr:hypothetical protein SASPL_100220 [Salvia splendens]
MKFGTKSQVIRETLFHLREIAFIFSFSRRSGANYYVEGCTVLTVRAADLDQNTIVAIAVGVVSVAVGIGIPIFYETQIDSAAKRENTQPCFPCDGSGARLWRYCSNNNENICCILVNSKMVGLVDLIVGKEKCRFCMGTGSVSVELGGDEKEISRCINCDGAGSLTCTTCQGSGIQPRYLDRREFKDDD